MGLVLELTDDGEELHDSVHATSDFLRIAKHLHPTGERNYLVHVSKVDKSPPMESQSLLAVRKNISVAVSGPSIRFRV
ncbi:hypothetical protein OsI_19312 [Oryza sativa Indica Group]|jgi:hypothetical protein|uniref:Uncharacterized protein n=1 Tax=Oryza sativa subsp. indica TaxID=39946 RepID=B8AW42_ORYSI|nr:hypothetical protein OsI_19312 [Oryza sativa Indica Group]